MDELILIYGPLYVVSLSLLLKLVLFFAYKSKRDKFTYILYYPYQNIVLTSNNNKRKIKEFQNILTVIIVSFSLFVCVIFYIFSGIKV